MSPTFQHAFPPHGHLPLLADLSRVVALVMRLVLVLVLGKVLVHLHPNHLPQNRH
jgi:hypothetical protein